MFERSIGFMKRSQFNSEQIVFALRQAESWIPITEVRRLKILKEKNRKLKQLVEVICVGQIRSRLLPRLFGGPCHAGIIECGGLNTATRKKMIEKIIRRFKRRQDAFTPIRLLFMFAILGVPAEVAW
jgi:hypothetical protein